MDRDIHPSEVGLFTAAALRGFRLFDSACGELYRVERGQIVIYTAATHKEVANLCGASGRTTLRQAAERDGLTWPSTPKAWLKTLKGLGHDE